MPTAKVYDIQGAEVGEQELSEAVFGMPVHTAVLYQVVTAQLWNRRQGNASTKTRSQVSGGNHKPYKQKGTGRARQGSTRAPHFRGGGSVFGPRPHAYHAEVPRKVRRIAMRSALSDKVNNERVFVLKDFTLEAPRTRTMIDFFAALELHDEVHAHPSVLILLAERDESIIYSMRNIPYIKVGHVAAVNIVEIMKYDFLMLTPEAVDFLETTFDDGIPTPDDVTAEEEA